MRVVRRLWRLPVWAHLAALVMVVAALGVVVGTGASFSADEGAVIIQARSLSRGDGWIVDHPVPGVDAEGRWYPLELSARGPKGVAPFAKHPLYAVLLAGADRAGGVTAMVMLSLLGTVAAAGVAAALVRRIDPALARPALWAVGIASPLLFDGYLVIAHTLGAALVGVAVLVAVTVFKRRRPGLALLVALPVFLAVLLRTEAVLFAVALAAVAAMIGLVALVRRSSVRDRVVGGLAVGAAAASVVGAVGGVLVERAWARAVVGATPASTGGGPVDDLGFVAGRVESFLLTWVRPGYDGGLVEALMFVMAAALIAAVVLARRRPQDGGPIRFLALLAAAAAVTAVVVSPTNLVPGLLMAFPLAAVGLAAIRRDTLESPTAQACLGTFALFALAVIATQYTSGGSGEWGGRYFALGIPVLVPVVLVALRDLGRRLPDVAVRQWAAGALVVCSLAIAAMGVLSIRSTHRFTADLMAGIDHAGQVAAAEGAGVVDRTRPLFVTTEPAIPRLAWSTFADQRWLLVRPGEVGDVLSALRADGFQRVTVVAAGPERDRLHGTEILDSVFLDSHLDTVGWRVEVLALG